MKDLLLEAFRERWNLMVTASSAAASSLRSRLVESGLRAMGIAVALGSLSAERMHDACSSMRRRKPPGN